MTTKFIIEFDKDDYIQISNEDFYKFVRLDNFENMREYSLKSNGTIFHWYVCEYYDYPDLLNNPLFVIEEKSIFALKKFFPDFLDRSYEEWKQEEEITAKLIEMAVKNVITQKTAILKGKQK